METKFIGIVNKNGEFLSELKLKGKALAYEARWSSLLQDALLTPAIVCMNEPEELERYKHMAKMVEGRLVEVEVIYIVSDIETGEEVEIIDADKMFLKVKEANKNSGGLLGALLGALRED